MRSHERMKITPLSFIINLAGQAAVTAGLLLSFAQRRALSNGSNVPGGQEGSPAKQPKEAGCAE